MIFKGPCDVKMECGWGRWGCLYSFLGKVRGNGIYFIQGHLKKSDI